MLHRPSSFRKKATAFATAAGGGGGGGAMIGTAFGFTAASAQDVASNSNSSSTCSQKFGPTDAGVRCAIRQMDRDIADAKARGTAAEKRGAAAEVATKCMEGVGKEIEAAKAKGPLAPDVKAAV